MTPVRARRSSRSAGSRNASRSWSGGSRPWATRSPATATLTSALTELSPDAFLADIVLAKTILQDVVDTEVKGYRAPSFSIDRSNDWAHDCIAEAGYRYSSSIYPIKHDHYGIPDAPRFALPQARGLGRGTDHHRPPVRPELARRRRWLFPSDAVRHVAMAHPPGATSATSSLPSSTSIRGISTRTSRGSRG